MRSERDSLTTSVAALRWPTVMSISAAVILLGVGVALALEGKPTSPESDEARRERLENLSAEEREELRAKKERFDRMTPEEQAKIRAFHERLSSAADGARLRSVMDRYNEWLKTLTPGQRADLLAMPADKRIEEIRKIRSQQEENRLRRLAITRITPDDSKAIFTWLGEFADRNRDTLVSQMPPERREFFEKDSGDPRRRRWMLMGQLFRSGPPANGATGLKPTKEDVDRLVGQLSAEPRAVLEKIQDPSHKLFIVREWVGASIANKFMPEVDQKDLEQYYAKLEQKDRDALDRLPRDQMFQELKRMYVASTFRRPGEPGKGGPSFHGFGPNTGPGRFGVGRPGGNGPRGDGPRGDGKWDGKREGRPDRVPGPSEGRGDNRPPGPPPSGAPPEDEGARG